MDPIKFLSVAVLLLSLITAVTEAKGPQTILISPAWNKDPFQCQFRPDSFPPEVHGDLVRFRVTVKGGKSPYTWRIPLYKYQNGANDVAMARVGTASPDNNRSFTIDLSVLDLEKTEHRDLEVRLESQDSLEAKCSVPSQSFQQVAGAPVTSKVAPMQGAVIR